MQQKRWPIYLATGLLVAFCFYVLTCGVMGFALGRASSNGDGSQDASRPAEIASAEEPVPIATLDERPPVPIEEETAHLVEAATLPSRDLLDLAHRLQGLPKPYAVATPAVVPEYDPGDSVTFWVHNVGTNSYFTATAVLRYETPHAYWWIEEEGYDIPDRNLRRSAENFEQTTYPTARRYFGSEWTPGIDGDPHVYIYLGDVPGLGGYFSGPDEYPTLVRPHSNEHEMFYVNLENAEPGDSYFDGILAHEFQHMIHWAEDRDESTWVNEGLSELSAQLCGYDVGGSDYMFSLSPDTQLTTWTELEDSAAHYGASYLFLSYFREQFGEAAVRALVAEPANGIAGFEAILAQVEPGGRRFDDIFADWVVANYVDDPDLGHGRFGYVDLWVEEPELADEHDSYPVQRQATVRQYAADYILLEGRADLTIEFSGNQVVPLVGNEAHSGQYQWWSFRGDDSDATLTRAFDLRGLESATLEAWMWYDLELDYDYAYVEVSTDGGETWNILSNEHTTTTNPSGNSYGPALTGLSGGGEKAEWSPETFDLSPYAGQEVLVRFEVVTDEALNHPGLVVDDISIPELGYACDVEEGGGGWQAAGWLRVTDHVPQEFVVQLITLGDGTLVERMPLDEENRGWLILRGLGRQIERAVLVVSALGTATTEPAVYSYRITVEE